MNLINKLSNRYLLLKNGYILLGLGVQFWRLWTRSNECGYPKKNSKRRDVEPSTEKRFKYYSRVKVFHLKYWFRSSLSITLVHYIHYFGERFSRLLCFRAAFRVHFISFGDISVSSKNFVFSC